MPEKRKKDISGGKNSKRSKHHDDKDFTSYMLSNFESDLTNVSGSKADSSDDDSDADVGGFSAFDLPSYGGLDDDVGAANDDEKGKSSNNGGIIFVSDPSQLPQPISFNTPTLMSPVVIGQNVPVSQPAQGQVIVMNKTVSSKSGKMVNHVQPVVMPAMQSMTSKMVKPGSRSSITITSRGKPVQSSNNHIAVPVTTILAASSQARPMQNVRQARPQVANSSIGAKVSNMSASDIMQQVMAAAQQAAKNIRAAANPRLRPAGQQMRPATQNIRQTSQQVRHATARYPQPRTIGTVRPAIRSSAVAAQNSQNHRGNVQVLQNRRGGSAQNISSQSRPVINGNANHSPNSNVMDAAKKWKPYSEILNLVSKRLTKESSKKLGINPHLSLNLKQMYSLLRRKFNTNQIYDMCLWDMEHPDASLLEIAIANAFNS